MLHALTQGRGPCGAGGAGFAHTRPRGRARPARGAAGTRHPRGGGLGGWAATRPLSDAVGTREG